MPTNNEQDSQVVVKATALQRVLNYLETKPHNEVRQLIDSIVSDYKNFEELLAEELAKTHKAAAASLVKGK